MTNKNFIKSSLIVPSYKTTISYKDGFYFCESNHRIELWEQKPRIGIF